MNQYIVHVECDRDVPTKVFMPAESPQIARLIASECYGGRLIKAIEELKPKEAQVTK